MMRGFEFGKRFFLVALCFAVVLSAAPAFAGEDEGEDNRVGWFGQVRAKMMAKQYGLTDDEALSLMEVLNEGTKAQQANFRALKDVHEELALARDKNADDATLLGVIAKINENRRERERIESSTLDRVITLLGAQKGTKWILAQRSMSEKFKSSVEKAKEKTKDDGQKEKKTKPSPGPRVGNAGYF